MNAILIRLRLCNALLALAMCLAGCSTRSISDSGYKPRNYRTHEPSRPPANGYRGELSELAVLGIDPATQVSEEDIRQALVEAKQVRLKKGGTILLIQSGAAFPDGPMVTELERYFRVIPFSGVPPEPAEPKATNSTPKFSRSLRLVAARGGAETIVCYWGVLESASRDLVTRKITWVPVVDYVVPDEVQKMRIRLKVAVIDVRTGNWSVFSIEPGENAALSTRHGREYADQSLVHSLKDTAYHKAVKELVKNYAAN